MVVFIAMTSSSKRYVAALHAGSAGNRNTDLTAVRTQQLSEHDEHKNYFKAAILLRHGRLRQWLCRTGMAIRLTEKTQKQLS